MSDEKQAKRKSKAQLRKPPEGTVVWTEQTFDRLVTGVPEQLVSRMRVDNSMLINVLGREEDAFPVLRRLLTDNHETERDKLRLARRALRLARSLRAVRHADPARRGRRVRAALRADRRPARGLRAQPGARALRAGRARRARPRGGGAHARHRLGDRGGARGAAADPVRPAARRPRRGGQRDEGRRHRVRGADGRCSTRSPGRSRWPSCSRRRTSSTARATRGCSEDLLGPKSIVREMYEQGMSFTDFVEPLPAGPVRGAGAALPHRRLPDDPADGARLAPDPRARGPLGVAGGDDPADRLLAARRVGGADRPRGGRPAGRRAGRAPAAALAAADLQAGPRLPGDDPQRDVAPGRPGRPRRPGRADGARAGRGRPDRPARARS